MTIAHRTIAWATALLLAMSAYAGAQQAPFANGWTLDADASNLRFQSIKNSTKVESSSFATFSGEITEEGTATLTVLLDSVDTKIDLRNVRMRFLFFETFNFPQAVIAAQLDPEDLADLGSTRRKTLIVPFTIDLHGVTKSLQAEVVATLLTDDIVSIASAAPVSLAVADFALDENLTKLEEAAGNITILPSATVTFDFLFKRNSANAADVVAQAAQTTPAKAALETEGTFSNEACLGRFEILSRTGNIEFRAGSARLDSSSFKLLENVRDIVERCPDLRLELAGHTDSDGSNAANQRLSERRAASVVAYLTSEGVDENRLVAKGYGEIKPLVPNTTASNKRRNRRIEFSVLP